MTSEGDWAAAVAATLDAFGTLNVLVNNAGILMHKKIADMTLADFRRRLYDHDVVPDAQAVAMSL